MLETQEGNLFKFVSLVSFRKDFKVSPQTLAEGRRTLRGRGISLETMKCLIAKNEMMRNNETAVCFEIMAEWRASGGSLKQTGWQMSTTKKR
jgi:hypothetical protein